MFSESDLLPISALQHMLFCPRQCALIHVERLWAENSLTLEGRHLHAKADSGTAERKGRPSRRAGKGDLIPADASGPPLVRITRSLPLRSLELGLVGQADVVEFRRAATPPPAAPVTEAEHSTTSSDSSAGVPYPVEYKRGKPKTDGSDAVQLCAQALCLEEMLGTPVPRGAIFYGKLRRRAEVVFDAALRSLTRQTIDRLRTMVDEGTTPPAIRDKKCERCSLRFLCLPDATTGSKSAKAYLLRSLKQLIPAGAATD